MKVMRSAQVLDIFRRFCCQDWLIDRMWGRTERKRSRTMAHFWTEQPEECNWFTTIKTTEIRIFISDKIRLRDLLASPSIVQYAVWRWGRTLHGRHKFGCHHLKSRNLMKSPAGLSRGLRAPCQTAGVGLSFSLALLTDIKWVRFYMQWNHLICHQSVWKWRERCFKDRTGRWQPHAVFVMERKRLELAHVQFMSKSECFRGQTKVWQFSGL